MKVKRMHSAGGVLIKDGKVLLIHWDMPRDSYDFPKGGIRWLESPEKACVREFYEETGYKTRVVRYIGQNHYEYDWVDGSHHSKTVDYYLLELTDGVAHAPRREKHETFENVWVDVDKAEALITREINKDIFKQALEMVY